MTKILDEFRDSLDMARLRVNAEDLELLGPKKNYIDLLKNVENMDSFHRGIYDSDNSVEIYRNFLDWLFATFKTTEDEFRQDWIRYLNIQSGDKVLITSCGLGEDIFACSRLVGKKSGFVHAQDLSKKFVRHASAKAPAENVALTISNALNLPYKDDYFDAVCHFGGINLFDDIKKAIHEMTRVCKRGGKVLFGDESVAPHLRNTDYGKMFIKNNMLWGASLPLEHLPSNARNITTRFVLGNCFYLIGFGKGDGLPDVDIDIPHLGHRGGSVRTRYYGQLEGVDPALKAKIYGIARERGLSVSQILGDLIKEL